MNILKTIIKLQKMSEEGYRFLNSTKWEVHTLCPEYNNSKTCSVFRIGECSGVFVCREIYGINCGKWKRFKR